MVTPSDSQTGCLLTSSNDTETVAGVTSTALIILDVLSTYVRHEMSKIAHADPIEAAQATVS